MVVSCQEAEFGPLIDLFIGKTSFQLPRKKERLSVCRFVNEMLLSIFCELCLLTHHSLSMALS